MTDTTSPEAGVPLPHLRYVPPTTLNHVQHVLSNLARPLPVNPFSFFPPTSAALPLKLMGAAGAAAGCLYPWGLHSGAPDPHRAVHEFENRLSFPTELQSPNSVSNDICKGKKATCARAGSNN